MYNGAHPATSMKILHDLKRWMYRGQRPNRIARIMNRASAAVASSGITSDYMVTLEVTGRKSGRIISLPVVIAIVAGERYLVSMLGENVQWVQNVRAAGGRAVLRSGGREAVQLEEVFRRPACTHLEGLPAASTGSATPRAREQGCSACGIREDRGGISVFRVASPRSS